MSLESDTLRRLQERTATRRLLGLIPEYTAHSRRGIARPRAAVTANVDCVHMRGPTEEFVECARCKNNRTSLRLFHCDKFHRCTTVTKVGGAPCCATCTSREPRSKPDPEEPMKSTPALKWACGVTTVPSRQYTTLMKTLASLQGGGFGNPRLFVDGAISSKGYEGEVTTRWPAVHAWGNFLLGLMELYIRDPLADLYAVFQDDILVCRNTRQYVEATMDGISARQSPKPVYLNLITFAPNEDLVRENGTGWWPSNQLGWGAQGTVFPRETLIRMFQSKHLAERPLGMRGGVPYPERAWKNLDGGICASIKSIGGIELVHYPSLVYHVDCESAIGNSRDRRTENGKWMGEDFDAMSWLGQQSGVKHELANEVTK